MMRVLSHEPVPPSKPSSSSTSLRSLSMESPSEYTSLLFNVPIPSTTYNAPSDDQPPLSHHRPSVSQGGGGGGLDPALSLVRAVQFPFLSMQREEDNAMARAYLAVISSSSSAAAAAHSPSSSQARPESFASNFQKATAFRRYSRSSSSSDNLSRNVPAAAVPPAAIIRRLQGNMFKKCVAFFRNLHLLSRRGLIHGGGAPPSTTQVHHVISERRRREKINESFQQLRSLLPPGSKVHTIYLLINACMR